MNKLAKFKLQVVGCDHDDPRIVAGRRCVGNTVHECPSLASLERRKPGRLA